MSKEHSEKKKQINIAAAAIAAVLVCNGKERTR